MVCVIRKKRMASASMVMTLTYSVPIEPTMDAYSASDFHEEAANATTIATGRI